MVTRGWGKWSGEGLAIERKADKEIRKKLLELTILTVVMDFHKHIHNVKIYQTVQFNHAQFFCMSIQ